MLVANSQVRSKATLHLGWMLSAGWYPLLAKKGETPVEALGALL